MSPIYVTDVSKMLTVNSDYMDPDNICDLAFLSVYIIETFAKKRVKIFCFRLVVFNRTVYHCILCGSV